MTDFSRRDWLCSVGIGVAGAALGAVEVRRALRDTPRPLADSGVLPPVSPVSPVSTPVPSLATEASAQGPRAYPPPRPVDRELVLSLTNPIAVGTALGALVVTDVFGLHRGAACLAVRAPGGRRVQVDICKRDAAPDGPQPMARTKRYDLFLANATPSAPGMGADVTNGLRRLAAVIEGNEHQLATLPLLTLRERWQQYPDESYMLLFGA